MRKQRLHAFYGLLLGLLVVSLFALFPHHAAAANPGTINFQGKVTNPDGTNVTNGSYSFVFRLYQNVNINTYNPNASNCSSDTNCWWEESDTLTVTNGVFQVELGASCAFSSACSSGHSGINFNGQNALSLTMQFNSDAAGFMTPLMHLQSVPYAYNSDALGGLNAGNYVQLAQGLQTDSSTTNASIAINKTNASGTPDILLLQKSGKNVLEVNNSGTTLLGQAGASGLNGTLTFNNSVGSNTVSLSLQADPGSSYTLLLPATGPATSQCLQTDATTANQLKFASCAGGTPTLQQVYDASSSQPQIVLDSSPGASGIVIQDNATPLTGNLFTIQANGTGSTPFFNVTSTNLAINNNTDNTGYLNTPYGGFGQYSNLLVQSEAFNNGSWVKASVTTPTANTVVAPDTNTTAESLADSGAGGSVCQFSTTAAANTTFTFSVWLKAASNISAQLRVDGGPTSCPTAATVTGTAATAPVTTAWQRFSVTQAIGTCASCNAKVFILPGGAGTQTVSAWGAQLVTGSNSQVYVNTTSSAITTPTTGLNVSGNSTFSPVTDSTSAFQIQNSSGSSLVNADTTNMRLGVDVTYASMTVPSGLTSTASSGAGFTAGQSYLYEVTAIDSLGGQTTVSNEPTACAPASTNLQCTLAWTAVTGASGYKVYRTANGGGTGTEKYLTTVLANAYIDTNAITLSATNPPGNNSAYISTNTSASLGQISIGGLGTPTGQAYISGVAPKLVGQNTFGNTQSVGGIWVSGKYAYFLNSITDKLNIFDVSNPTTPTFISANTDSNLSGATWVQVQGKYAYIASATNKKLAVCDISNPSNFSCVVNSDTKLNIPSGLYVQGRYVYILNTSKIFAYDISNPLNPVYLSTVSVGSNLYRIVIEGSNAVVMDKGTHAYVCNVSNPKAMTCGSGVSLTGSTSVRGLAVQGKYAYIGDFNSHNLYVVDISNPASPVLVSTASTGSQSIDALQVQGRYVYAAMSGSPSIAVVDVSNPYSPVTVATTSSTASNGTEIFVSGRYLYQQAPHNTSSDFYVYDLGGLYAQQLEAGGVEAGTIQIDANGQIGGDLNIQGGLTLAQALQTTGDIATTGALNVQGSTILSGGQNYLPPPSPAISFTGTTGGASGTWSYVVTSVNAAGQESLASATKSLSTPGSSNASLSGANHNDLSWSSVTGAISYNIYRTSVVTSPTTIGLIGNTASTSFSDTIIAGDGTTAPAITSTSQLAVLGSGLIKSSSNTTTAFQVQNSSNQSVLSVDTTNGQIVLGNSGAGVNGTIVFNNSSGSNTATITLASNPTTSYNYQLPTGTVSSGQCLQSGTVSGADVPLTFASCSAGGGDNGSVNGSAVTDFNLQDVAGSGTVTGTTWTGTGSSPTNVTLAIVNASASAAGAVTNGTQTFAGVKTFQDFVILQPAASMTSGQTALTQTITNASSTGGTVNGFSQSVTVSNTSSASTTNGLKIALADNASSIANTNVAIQIDLTGTNSSSTRKNYGIVINNAAGSGITSKISASLSGSLCNATSISAAICASAPLSNGDSTNASAGVYAEATSSSSSIGAQLGAAVVGVSNDTGQNGGGTGRFFAGVKGITAQTNAGLAYTSIGVYGEGKGGTASTVYGGYFALNSASGATAGAALYATNSTISANIMDLQDNTTSVFTVGNGGVTTAKSNSATGFQIQDSSSSKQVLTVDTSGDQVLLGKAGASGLDGKLVFNNATGSNTATIVLTGNPTTSYTYQLPTGTVSSNQCLQSGTVSGANVPLTFASCGGGGGVFTSSAGIITKSTISDALKLQYGDAGDTQLLIENTTNAVIPAADVMQIDATGGTTGIVTDGVDGLQISTEFGNGTSNTNSGLHISVSPVNTPSGDETFYGVNIDGITGTAAAETALNIGTGWDTGISAQSPVLIKLASTTAFQVQNASNTVLGVDTSANQVLFGNSSLAGKLAIFNGSNSVSIQAAGSTAAYAIVLPASAGTTNQCLVNTSTPGTLQWLPCGAGATGQITLVPEYPGAVMTGDGSSNTGTMTSDFCSGSSLRNIPSSGNPCGASEEHNFYTWVTTSQNDYDIWVRWQVPTDFSDFAASNAIQMYGWRTDNTATTTVTLNLYNASGTLCGTATNVATGTATWTQTSLGGTVTASACSISAGQVVEFRIQMAANNKTVRAGEITINYQRN